MEVFKSGNIILELRAVGKDEIRILMSREGERHIVILTTHDLVMAIKKIEEERDADREPTRRDSEKLGLYDYAPSFRDALYRAAEKLRTMFRDPRGLHIPATEDVKILRSLYEARTISEIELILRRAEEVYLRPDRPETRSKSVDDLATEAAREAWAKYITGKD
jgi:hypothetical protein